MRDTKTYILQTSLLLFLQKSYRDVTMQEIVQKTELSKGAFYHYFTSKEQLFKEIVMLFFEAGNMNYESFPSHSLKAFIDYYTKQTSKAMNDLYQMVGGEENAASMNFFYILFEAVGRFPEFLAIELETYKKSVEAWKKVIENARSNGEINSIATDDEIAALFLYCTDGVFVRFANNDRKSNFSSDLQRAMNTIYLGIKS